jgi:hypothetical protein
MLGPFKMAPGGLTHLLVAVDKFTKWIKAKPIKKIDGSSTIKFFNEIIVRYGVPHNIITDNGTNFAKGVFAELCSQNSIQLDLASVAHPQSGQVEKANGLILAGIKPRLVEPLERSAGCWVESYPQYSGACALLLTALSASLLSFWSMGQRQCCLPTSSSTHPG